MVGFYVPQVLTGTVQYDGVDVHYSAQRYLADELHAGRLPFWTQYLFSGFPFLADVQVGTWYPLNWPFLLVGIGPKSLSGELLLHSLVACGGAYALGWRLIGDRYAAAGVALFYGLSGWFATHSQHVGMFAAAAWLPWLVLVLIAVRDRLDLQRLALASLVVAALALPGHFQTALYALCGAAAGALLEAIADRSRPAVGRLGVCLAVCSTWGALLAAVMILPGLELVDLSVRTELNARDVNLGYFHPEALLTLVQPDHYGLLSGDYTGPGDVTQHYFYAGVLLTPLAVLGARHRRLLLTAVCLSLPFAWYALGPDAWLFRVIARLPGFRSVELPMHGWFLPTLGLALLGGAGLTHVPARWRAPLLALVFADVLVFNQVLNPLAFARESFVTLYDGPLSAFAAEIVATRPAVVRIAGRPRAAIGYRNHALQSRVPTTYGYNPLELLGYAAYQEAAETNPRLLDGLAASHVLTGDRLVVNPSALPLAFFAARTTSVDDLAAAGVRLRDLDPASETLVVGPAPALADADPGASAAVVDGGTDWLQVHVRTATPGLLRVAIAAYPGWQATLDGVELEMLIVDRALIGVITPAGEGDVHLAFHPRWAGSSALVSLAALCACGAALSQTFRRAARRAIRRGQQTAAKRR